MPDPYRWRARLRHRDQAVIAGATLVGWSLLVMAWGFQGGFRGHLVDIDRATPRPIAFRLDINRADWPELTLLPGIGEMRARRIVALRQRTGALHDPRDLLEVKGIGPKTLHGILPYLLPIEIREKP